MQILHICNFIANNSQAVASHLDKIATFTLLVGISMVSYYNMFIDPSVYSTPTGAGDSVANIYAGRAKLIGFSAYNTSMSTVYAQVFDQTGTPASAGVPVALLEVPAASQESFDVGSAHWHAVQTGITIAASSTSTTYTAAGGSPLFITCYYSV
jgi:hypothetical protein